ncbi:cupredoxin domain-containing protein [Sphingobium vermicomposti]|uniref:Plastocyanin n=1 Tax=Sphingobium vermicomposti TaxID=529005 RepID=A0A846M435_9SPHN|nr:cupredoxin domain-containing protein [Sphingobium vermicomposti]NIJ16313.1 plastocyanin [Sphingobium vermicomposti]
MGRFQSLATAIAGAALLAPPPAGATPRGHVVVIANMKFGPVPPHLKAGDTIIWINKDIIRHTATAKDQTFHVDLPPGGSGKTVVPGPGRHAFYCVYHPTMTGLLSASK